jgi:hypothetical protein
MENPFGGGGASNMMNSPDPVVAKKAAPRTKVTPAKVLTPFDIQ